MFRYAIYILILSVTLSNPLGSIEPAISVAVKTRDAQGNSLMNVDAVGD
jgi:hypothetical protein